MFEEARAWVIEHGPLPIAAAWKATLTSADPLRGLLQASEATLRVWAWLAAADLRAHDASQADLPCWRAEKPHPWVLNAPTLGSLRMALQRIPAPRDAACASFAAAVARMMGKQRVQRALEDVNHARNAVAHAAPGDDGSAAYAQLCTAWGVLLGEAQGPLHTWRLVRIQGVRQEPTGAVGTWTWYVGSDPQGSSVLRYWTEPLPEQELLLLAPDESVAVRVAPFLRWASAMPGEPAKVQLYWETSGGVERGAMQYRDPIDARVAPGQHPVAKTLQQVSGQFFRVRLLDPTTSGPQVGHAVEAVVANNSNAGLWILGGALGVLLLGAGALGGVLLFRGGSEPPPEPATVTVDGPGTFVPTAPDVPALPPDAATVGQQSDETPQAAAEPPPAPALPAKLPPAPTPEPLAGDVDAETGDDSVTAEAAATADTSADAAGAADEDVPAVVVFDEAVARRAALTAATGWLESWGARRSRLAELSLPSVVWNGAAVPVATLVEARGHIVQRELLSFDAGITGDVTASGAHWFGVVRTTHASGRCRIDAVTLALRIPPDSPADGSTWNVAAFTQAATGAAPPDRRNPDPIARVPRWLRVQGDVTLDRQTGLQWNEAGMLSVPQGALDLAATRNQGERDLACSLPTTRWAEDAQWRPPTLAEWDGLVQAIAAAGRSAGGAAPTTTSQVWVQDSSGRMMRYDASSRITQPGDGLATVMLVRTVPPESLSAGNIVPLVMPQGGTLRRVGE